MTLTLLLSAIVFVSLLLRTILTWKIHLYGSNAGGPDGLNHFTFAIQNGEDVELDVPFRLEIRIDQGGCEIHGEPELYCGPKYKVRASALATDRRCFWVEAATLPPFDTWVLRLKSDAHPNNVAFRLRPPEQGTRPGAGHPRWRFLRPHELRQAPGAESSLPARTPSWWVLLFALCLALVMYLTPVLLHDRSWLPLSAYFSPWNTVDWLIITPLVLLSYLVFHASRIAPLPVIQGYLDDWRKTFSSSMPEVRDAVPQAYPNGARAAPSALQGEADL